MFKSSVIVRTNGEEFETHNTILLNGYAYIYYRIFGLRLFTPWRLVPINSSLLDISGVNVGRPIWDYEFLGNNVVGNSNFIDMKFNSAIDVAGIATLFETEEILASLKVISVSSFLTMILFPSIVRTDFLSIKYNIFI
jgi:energy-converting hydrogenase Eha subunit E